MCLFLFQVEFMFLFQVEFFFVFVLSLSEFKSIFAYLSLHMSSLFVSNISLSELSK
jgi:hypothetical protein